ncbi:hypothetical protein JHK87_049037 [Glycine soja]|nr:hypothetical protein JHK87_049037 [Glycine soja]
MSSEHPTDPDLSTCEKAAERTDPVYAMFQCRNYHSNTDCATCFAAAAAEIRNSSVGTNAAHVVYDGCFLKYESTDSFDQICSSSHTLCGNQTADASTGFGAVGQQVLVDLQKATPKISGYFTATKTQVAGGAIYAIAQCDETFTQANCLDCLTNEQSSTQDPNKYDVEEVKKLIGIALLCIQASTAMRPVMPEVVVLLS